MAGSEDSDNFLEHSFHDSFLKGVERDGRDVTLVIDTDIYWFPGKPITLLKLVYADSISELQDLAAKQGLNDTIIQKAKVVREDDGSFNFKLVVEMASGEVKECKCYNFWTERKEEYKDYKTTSHT